MTRGDETVHVTPRIIIPHSSKIKIFGKHSNQ